MPGLANSSSCLPLPLLQSGVIAGDLTNRGAAFWKSLQMLALGDPNPCLPVCFPQSGVIAGDLTNRGAAFWEALQMLALADPNPMVSLEAIRAMFGAPYPKYEPLGRRRGAGAWGPEADEAVQVCVGALNAGLGCGFAMSRGVRGWSSEFWVVVIGWFWASNVGAGVAGMLTRSWVWECEV